MPKDFVTAVKERRSYYGISKESTVSDERIQEIIQEAVKYTPSPFNSQSARVVLLLGKHHDKLWDFTKEVLRAIVPANQFEATDQRINGFKNGYGTALFFEEYKVIEGMQAQFTAYQDRFPLWSEQSSGMLQYVIWTALEIDGLGASLQHYNPLIDEKVKAEWKIPESWQLIAQMPFGKPTAVPGNKEYQPLEERVKIFQ